MAKTQTLFRPTMTMENVMAEARHCPEKAFENWPLIEVRRTCLQNMKFIDGYRAKWIEGFLLEAERGGSGNRDPVGAEVLGWYVANAQNEMAVRAIEFAIRRRGAWENQFVSKIVAGRLQKDPWLWSAIPNLLEFLDECLAFLWADEHSNVYAESWWISAERALRLIALAEEVRLKPQVLRVLKGLRSRNLTPWGPPGSQEQFLRLAQHKAIVQATLQVLRAA